MSASPDALQIYVVASKQGATSREIINAISKTANSTSNTALSVLRGEYTSEATAIEYKRVKFKLLRVLWRDSEGPDEKVSRHTVCLFTQGRTLQFISTFFCLGRCMGRLLTHNVTPDYFSTPSLLASYSSRYVEAVMNCLLSRHNLEGMSRC
jgi:hypothetical protein